MPLCVVIRRDGQNLDDMFGYSWWHMAKIHEAMAEETPDVPKEDVEFWPSEYVFKFSHAFAELEEAIWNRGGEAGKTYVLQINPGDVYSCWRESKW